MPRRRRKLPPHKAGCQAQALTTFACWVTEGLQSFHGTTRILTKRLGTSATASTPAHKPYKPVRRAQRYCLLCTRNMPNHPAIPASPLTFLYGLCRKALSVPFDAPLSVIDATGVANIDQRPGCKPFLVPV